MNSEVRTYTKRNRRRESYWKAVFICLFCSGSLCMAQQGKMTVDTLQPIVIADSILKAQTGLADSLLAENFRSLQLLNPADSNQLQMIQEYDILITTQWETSIVKVKNISETKVEYYYPLNTQMHTISREHTSQIIYSNGRREVFQPLEVKENDRMSMVGVVVLTEKDWEKVEVGEKENSIPAGLTMLRKVDTRIEGEKFSTSNKLLEKNAMIVLRKKTANSGGSYLLITSKQFNRPYGDIPSIILEGEVYGVEPE